MRSHAQDRRIRASSAAASRRVDAVIRFRARLCEVKHLTGRAFRVHRHGTHGQNFAMFRTPLRHKAWNPISARVSAALSTAIVDIAAAVSRKPWPACVQSLWVLRDPQWGTDAASRARTPAARHDIVTPPCDSASFPAWPNFRHSRRALAAQGVKPDSTAAVRRFVHRPCGHRHAQLANDANAGLLRGHTTPCRLCRQRRAALLARRIAFDVKLFVAGSMRIFSPRRVAKI
jgi:hypothetical protein